MSPLTQYHMLTSHAAKNKDSSLRIRIFSRAFVFIWSQSMIWQVCLLSWPTYLSCDHVLNNIFILFGKKKVIGLCTTDLRLGDYRRNSFSWPRSTGAFMWLINESIGRIGAESCIFFYAKMLNISLNVSICSSSLSFMRAIE